jgi:hypothetical protein
MTLLIPTCISSQITKNPHLDFKWDEWGITGPEPDSELTAELEQVSDRARVTFAIGCTMWIVERFRPLVSDGNLLTDALDAAYCQTIDFRYSWDWELDNSWSGPVKGPLKEGMRDLVDGTEQLRDGGNTCFAGAAISSLCQFVLPNPQPFVSWQQAVLKSLRALYARVPDETIGEMVPLSVLDPSARVDPKRTERLVNEFLAGLDYVNNPFLNLPENMIEFGFPDTPYKFDADGDRDRRINW